MAEYTNSPRVLGGTKSSDLGTFVPRWVAHSVKLNRVEHTVDLNGVCEWVSFYIWLPELPTGNTGLSYAIVGGGVDGVSVWSIKSVDESWQFEISNFGGEVIDFTFLGPYDTLKRLDIGIAATGDTFTATVYEDGDPVYDSLAGAVSTGMDASITHLKIYPLLDTLPAPAVDVHLSRLVATNDPTVDRAFKIYSPEDVGAGETFTGDPLNINDDDIYTGMAAVQTGDIIERLPATGETPPYQGTVLRVETDYDPAAISLLRGYIEDVSGIQVSEGFADALAILEFPGSSQPGRFGVGAGAIAGGISDTVSSVEIETVVISSEIPDINYDIGVSEFEVVVISDSVASSITYPDTGIVSEAAVIAITS